MATDNTNVIKQIQVGATSYPIGVDWEHVEGNPSLPWSQVTDKPFEWDSKTSTLTITIL